MLLRRESCDRCGLVVRLEGWVVGWVVVIMSTLLKALRAGERLRSIGELRTGVLWFVELVKSSEGRALF